MDIRVFYDNASEELQDELYAVYMDDDADFGEWCIQHGIDLSIIDKRLGISALTLWVWSEIEMF